MERAASARGLRSSRTAIREIDSGSIVPSQFFNNAAVDSPERRLWLTVLGNAAEDTRAPDYHGKRREAARAWVLSGVKESIRDFETVCEVLGLEASVVRRYLVEQWEMHGVD